MPSTKTFAFHDAGDAFIASWEWALDLGDKASLRAIDVRIQSLENDTNGLANGNANTLNAGAKAVLSYITTTTRFLAKTSGSSSAAIKILVPTTHGYIVRNDFLKVRMVGSSLAHSFEHFVTPQQKLAPPNPTSAEFAEILEATVGAVVLQPSYIDDFDAAMSKLNSELENRLSFPLILPSLLTGNRLVIIGHRHPNVMAGGFLPEDMRSGAVEQCITIKMGQDDGMSKRIVDALATSGPYNAMVTFTDTWMIETAKAAELLGLYTLSLDLVMKCLDKHATRLLVQGASEPLRIKNVKDLQTYLKTSNKGFEYPLIVKPCTAWGSQGVYKAANETELLDAVAQAAGSAKGMDLLVDTYINGPEVDANFILQDGKILFFELVDGFPCTAEIPNLRKPGDFLETDQMWPSNHPQKEQDLLRNTLHKLLLDMGIRDGIFHVEARVRNSAVHYTEKDGILDLRARETPSKGEPIVFLLEVNQRPPGHGGSWGAALSSGIDYPALHIICALQDKERYRALSQPFANGAVQWVDSVFINADAGGIYDGYDVCQELQEKRPDLFEYVKYCNCYYDHGEEVTDSPARIALFVVASPISRQKVLEIAKEVRQEVVVKMQYKA
ncbi:ATP-grasp enzyme fsqD [Cladobotryum mycophilum]|uniref:ATP-grasp enzyme fsqD n=1 Tax=Cladobotryum mycophilum TaxID=491253 RepID=A0ABR0SJ74_9HYPO